MKKTLHILLLLAVSVPLAGYSREETLEERKLRIVRKYLRKGVNITQSDMVVPSDLPEDEAVKNSEKFKEPSIDLEREESSAVSFIPPPPRPVAKKESSNWLLDGLDTDAENPFAADSSAINSESSPSDDYWSLWGGKPSRSEAAAPVADSRRQRQGYNPYTQEDRGGQFMDSRSRSFTEDSTRQSGRYVAGETDIFGRSKRAAKSTGEFGVNNFSRTYGSSPDGGLLTSPSSSTRSSENRASGGASSRREESGFQPYKNPYTTETDERRLQGGATAPRNEQDTYRRPDPYQQWKDRSKSFDPTKDDAYIDELMRNDRR